MKKIKECIVLAGGFGTRLKSVIADMPKCMASINNKPFLEYLFDYLEKENFTKVVLSLGYKSEVIVDWLSTINKNFDIEYVIEENPLGTGGAIKFASEKINTDTFFVFNGDTLFDINTDKLLQQHQLQRADISIALKKMNNFNRYGTVKMNSNHRITDFIEKQPLKEGIINGGIYILNKQIFPKNKTSFSFEKEVLECSTSTLIILGYEFDSYFIDIGIPEDYEKMNRDFKNS